MRMAGAAGEAQSAIDKVCGGDAETPGHHQQGFPRLIAVAQNPTPGNEQRNPEEKQPEDTKLAVMRISVNQRSQAQTDGEKDRSVFKPRGREKSDPEQWQNSDDEWSQQAMNGARAGSNRADGIQIMGKCLFQR